MKKISIGTIVAAVLASYGPKLYKRYFAERREPESYSMRYERQTYPSAVSFGAGQDRPAKAYSPQRCRICGKKCEYYIRYGDCLQCPHAWSVHQSCR